MPICQAIASPEKSFAGMSRLCVCGLVLGLLLQRPEAWGTDLPSRRIRAMSAGIGCPTGAFWCPDNYVPKPLLDAPCIPGCPGPDDYQPKMLPGFPCWLAPCCPDSYCPKPLVGVPPLTERWHTCGTVEQPACQQRQAKRLTNRGF